MTVMTRGLHVHVRVYLPPYMVRGVEDCDCGLLHVYRYTVYICIHFKVLIAKIRLLSGKSE
jgi:hypothetical protein